MIPLDYYSLATSSAPETATWGFWNAVTGGIPTDAKAPGFTMPLSRFRYFLHSSGRRLAVSLTGVRPGETASVHIYSMDNPKGGIIAVSCVDEPNPLGWSWSEIGEKTAEEVRLSWPKSSGPEPASATWPSELLIEKLRAKYGGSFVTEAPGELPSHVFKKAFKEALEENRKLKDEKKHLEEMIDTVRSEYLDIKNELEIAQEKIKKLEKKNTEKKDEGTELRSA